MLVEPDSSRLKENGSSWWLTGESGVNTANTVGVVMSD